MATMKDVAQVCGLSIATISKYLNGEKLRPENAVKIQKAIDTLGYRRNEIARGLKMNKSMTIGILVPDIRSSFATRLITGIEDLLYPHNYSTIVCDSRNDIQMEEEKLRFLFNKRVDALIVIPLQTDSSLIAQMAKKLPVIILDRHIEGLNTDYVLTDNYQVSTDAVNHLFMQGHKRIGLISGSDQFFTSQERLRGYLAAHQKQDIEVDPELIVEGHFDVEKGYHAAKKLLSLPKPPSALFVINYDMTIGTLMAIQELNLKIPDDISLITFDSLELSRIIQPKLTVVLQPYDEIIEKTALLVLGRIESKEQKEPEIIVLKNSLILNDSVAALPQGVC